MLVCVIANEANLALSSRAPTKKHHSHHGSRRGRLAPSGENEVADASIPEKETPTRRRQYSSHDPQTCVLQLLVTTNELTYPDAVHTVTATFQTRLRAYLPVLTKQCRSCVLCAVVATLIASYSYYSTSTQPSCSCSQPCALNRVVVNAINLRKPLPQDLSFRHVSLLSSLGNPAKSKPRCPQCLLSQALYVYHLFTNCAKS